MGRQPRGLSAGAKLLHAERPATPRARAAASPRPRPLTTAELAWLAAVPVAAIAVLAIVVLGPPLGAALLAPRHTATFWPTVRSIVRPEPTEQARFLLALLAPLLLIAVLALARARGPLRASPLAAARATWAIQALGAGFCVVCLLAQRRFTFEPAYSMTTAFHRAYFTNATLAVAVLGAGALLAAAHHAPARARLAGLLRDSRARRAGAMAAAALALAVWLLHAFNTEGSIGNAHSAVIFDLTFPLDETFAVLDGRFPLVDYAAQYASLWPFPVAGAMAVLGRSIGVFSGLMCLLTGVTMLAMYDVLRRVARSALAGLLLFLPFVATSFFLLRGPLENRYTLAAIFPQYPLRMAGPWLLAWLAARHLDGARPRRRWPLFLAAGLVAINNADHGIPALGALLAALLWGGWRPARADLRRLALELAGGLLAALALVAALTLASAGSLPQLGLALRFAGLYARAGFGMLPMPTLGLHTIVYLTFVAAIGAATVRAIDRAPARTLTGMLAWSGVFGLGSGSYYAGRSHPEVLVALLGTWTFALALLLIVVLRRVAARPSPWPAPAELACAVAFGLAACSLAQTPTPWSQVRRLERPARPILASPPGEALVAQTTYRGERVAILAHLGHRIGANLHVADVTPYAGSTLSMPTVEQYEETLRILRREGGSKLFLSLQDRWPEMRDRLRRDGFRRVGGDGTAIELWVDRAASMRR